MTETIFYKRKNDDRIYSMELDIKSCDTDEDIEAKIFEQDSDFEETIIFGTIV